MSVCKSHTRSHIVNLQVQYIQLYLHTCIVEVNYEGSAVIALSDWGIQLHAHALFSSSCESDIWIFCPHGHGFYSMQIHIYRNQVKRCCSTSQEMWSGKHNYTRPAQLHLFHVNSQKLSKLLTQNSFKLADTSATLHVSRLQVQSTVKKEKL